MSDDAHIGIQVEADASRVTATANQAAEALIGLIGKTKELEAALKGIFSGKLPANLKQLQGYVDNIEASSSGTRNDRIRASRAARELASGGAPTAIRRATVSGAVENIRTTGVGSYFKVLDAENKVLEERRRLYQDIRRANPTSSQDQIAEKYRLKLRDLGDEPGTKVRAGAGVNTAKALDEQRVLVKASHEKTLAELKQFNAEYNAEEEKALLKQRGIQEKKKAEERRRSPFGRLAQAAGYVADYALVGVGIGAATKVGGDVVQLEDKMNAIKADSGGTSQQVEGLSKAILDLGTKTRQTNTDLAETADQLLKSGYSFEQAQGAMKPIANLATATGSSMKDATDSVITVLKTFDLGADRADKVGNSLVALAQRSRLPIEQVAQGLQSVGNIAHQDGITFDELIATFGQLSQAGIKSGSTMGAGLKTLLTAIENPSKKLQDALSKAGMSVSDIDVKTHGLQGAMENLAKIDFLSALPARAANIAAALVKTKDSFDGIHEAVLNSNASNQAAEIRMQSLGAQTQRLINSLTALAYDGGGPLLRVLQGMVGGLAAVTEGMAKMGPVIGIVGTLIGSLVASSVVLWLANAAKAALIGTEAFTALAGAETLAAGATALLEGALVVLSGPVGWLAAGIATVAAVMWVYADASGAAKRKTEEAAAAAQKAAANTEEYKSHVNELDGEIARLSERHEMLKGNTNAVSAATEVAIGKFGEWGLQIRGRTGDVDVLIGSLKELRRQQSAAALGQAQIEKVQLGKEKAGLEDQKRPLNDRLRYLAGDASGRSNFAGVQAIVDRLKRGGAVQSGDLAAFTKAGLDKTKLGEALGKSTGITNQLSVVSGKMATLDQTTIQPLVTDNDPRAAKLRDDMQAFTQQMRDRRAKAYGMKGEARLHELAAIQKDTDTGVAGFNARIGSTADAIGGNSESGGAAAVRSQLSKGLSDVVPFGTSPSGLTSKQWKARAAMFRAQGNLRAAKDADRQAILADPNASEEDLETRMATDDAKAEKAGRSAANRGARNEATADKFDLKDKDREISQVVAEGGRGADLKKLLEERGGIQRRQLSNQQFGKGLTSGQVKRELDDLNEQIDEYTQKMVAGDLAGAAKVLVTQSENNLADTTGNLKAALSSGDGELGTALDKVQGAVTELLKRQLELSDEQFKAANPGVDPKFNKERVNLIRASAEKAIQVELDILKTYYAGQQGELDRASELAKRPGDQKRAQIAAYKNFYGVQNVGSVHNYLGDEGLRQLDVVDARRGVNEAQASLDLKNQKVASLVGADSVNKKFGIDDGGKTAAELKIAQDEAEKLEKALADAKNHLVAIDGSTQSFANYSEAAAAAWKKFSTEAKLNMPMTERFADGLHDALSAANGGMNKFFQDMISGTVKGKQAFASLGVAILQAIANKAIASAVDMLFGFVGGIGKGVPQSMIGLGGFGSGMKQGGEVRRMAQGGEVGAMNRDSVPILAEPGEVMMNKTAVDFIGKSNLLSMNTMGNRRISGVSSAARQAKREPDMTNVYVVAPNQQPGMTSKDVVVAITQDLLSNGQTKKLVKAIAMGNA
jgi:TP901 family phage tail tape measure protein